MGIEATSFAYFPLCFALLCFHTQRTCIWGLPEHHTSRHNSWNLVRKRPHNTAYRSIRCRISSHSQCM